MRVALWEVEDQAAAVDTLARATPVAAVVFADAGAVGRDCGAARPLKALRDDVPVLVLLRGGRDRAAVTAMRMGGDDVVRIPVTARELAARLRATARRLREAEAPAPRPDGQTFRVGGLQVDVGARRARRGGHTVPLTETELQLLATLAGSGGRPLSRERLLHRLCGFDYEIDSRTIDVHVRNLRRKIEADPAAPAVIRAVPGVGYCLREGGLT